jgi:hypothetical protein
MTLTDGILSTDSIVPRGSWRRGTVGGPNDAESCVIRGNPIQPKTAEPSVYAGRRDDCHAEGRGFESHQPLRERPLVQRAFFVESVRWYFCAVANDWQTVSEIRDAKVGEGLKNLQFAGS